MAITQRDLEDIYYVCLQLREIDEQIQAAYNTYRSPQFGTIRIRNNNASDPVARAFDRLQLLDLKKADCLDKWIAFEKKLCQIPEPDIQAIIRWRYLMPKKNGSKRAWCEINRLVYGYSDAWYGRKRFERFLNEQEEGETNGDKEET